jgi:hypothetical protein
MMISPDRLKPTGHFWEWVNPFKLESPPLTTTTIVDDDVTGDLDKGEEVPFIVDLGLRNPRLRSPY